MMIRLPWACRKIRLKRTTGIRPEEMISFSTFPAPTEGNWSVSPTMISVICSGMAFNRLYINIMSIMEHSSRMSTSPSSGFSSLRW